MDFEFKLQISNQTEKERFTCKNKNYNELITNFEEITLFSTNRLFLICIVLSHDVILMEVDSGLRHSCLSKVIELSSLREVQDFQGELVA